MKTVFDLMAERGLGGKRVSGTNGGEYHGPCPGCGGVDRFHVWPHQNDGAGSWWCRGCQTGGDPITFLMVFDGLPFRAAAEAVGRAVDRRGSGLFSKKALGRLMPPHPEAWTPSEASPREGVNFELWQEKAAAFVEWAAARLLESPEPLGFLAARGITAETAIRFRLGWNPGADGKPAIFRPRQAWGLPKEERAGKERRLWLPRGLVIPFFNDGSCLPMRIRIRRPTDDLTADFGQRYIVVPGSRMERMLIDPKNRVFFVVESELDAVLISQDAGLLAGAIALGTSHAKPDQACHAALSNAISIIVSLDNDEAGQSAQEWWGRQYRAAKIRPVPGVKDPGEMGAALKPWILSVLPPAVTMFLKDREQAAAPVQGPPKPEVPLEAASDDNAQKGDKFLPADDPQPEAPLSPVAELHRLISGSPVRIEFQDKRIRVIEPPGWGHKHWSASKRISELVFFSRPVQVFLGKHPARIITSANFGAVPDATTAVAAGVIA